MMTKAQAIGFFDSGVGGLSILKITQTLLPQENYFYLADQVNCPYGEKNPTEIKSLSLKAITFLVKHNCKLIVLACNTATVAAIKFLRQRFPAVIFVGVVPVVKPALKASQTDHVVVFSTTATAKSRPVRTMVAEADSAKVYNLACPGLVEMVEAGIFKGKQLSQKLKLCLQSGLNDNLVDVLAVGCTHYAFLEAEIVKLFKNRVKFIQAAKPVSQQIKRVLKAHRALNSIGTGQVQFCTTGNPTKFKLVASQLLGQKIKAKKVIL